MGSTVVRVWHAQGPHERAGDEGASLKSMRHEKWWSYDDDEVEMKMVRGEVLHEVLSRGGVCWAWTPLLFTHEDHRPAGRPVGHVGNEDSNHAGPFLGHPTGRPTGRWGGPTARTVFLLDLVSCAVLRKEFLISIFLLFKEM